MTKEFMNVCRDFDLLVVDENNQPYAANDIFKQIYYEWTMPQLQDFFNRLMEIETGGFDDVPMGEALFDD